MLGLLLQANINYNKDFNVRSFNKQQKTLQNIKKEIAQKKSILYEDPDIYSSDHSSSQGEETMRNSHISKKNTSFFSFNSKINDVENNNRVISKISKSYLQYKKLIKSLDIIIIILVFITCIMIQLDNSHTYNKNKKKRVLTSRLAQCISGDTTLVRGGKIIEINCTDNNYLNPEEYDEVFNKKNYLNQIDFNNKNVYQIPVHFEIDEYDAILRIFILIFTAVTIVLNFIVRKFQHIIVYYYSKQEDVSIFKTSIFAIFLIETIILLLIPYPNITRIFFYKELGLYILIPLSTYLSAFSLLRIIFILKILDSVTRWTSSMSEYICNKNSCKANEMFAFKAFQKEHPFIVLIFLLFGSCLVFGYSMRSFEILYWEHQQDSEFYQEWEYIWNCFWFVFVSMTTVGYGDFFPKTTPGRVCSLLCCFVGNYFVSTMMIFMTSITAKNEKEEKAYRLIIRLQHKEEIKNIYSEIIFCAFKTAKLNIKLKKKYAKNFFTQKNVRVKHILDKKSFLRQKMFFYMNRINLLKKEINRNTISLSKEKLFEICDRIKNDVEGIRYEMNFLEIINNSMKNYTNIQLKALSNLKKDYMTTKLLFEIISSNHELFPKVGNFLEIDKEIQKILKEPESKNSKRIVLSQTATPEKQQSHTPIMNIKRVKFNLLNSEIKKTRSTLDSEEKPKKTNSNKKNNSYTDILPEDPKNLSESFSFLFNQGPLENRTKSVLVKKKYSCKVSKAYEDIFDKVEMRKAERTNSSKKMNIYRHMSANNVSRKIKDDSSNCEEEKDSKMTREVTNEINNKEN